MFAPLKMHSCLKYIIKKLRIFTYKYIIVENWHKQLYIFSDGKLTAISLIFLTLLDLHILPITLAVRVFCASKQNKILFVVLLKLSLRQILLRFCHIVFKNVII